MSHGKQQKDPVLLKLALAILTNGLVAILVILAFLNWASDAIKRLVGLDIHGR